MLRRVTILAAALLLGCTAVPASARAQSNDPSFRVVNNTPETVLEVYASASTETSWGHDRLGTEVIRPGGTHIVRMQPGSCINDLRFVFQGGRAEERRNLNTCALTDVVLGGAAAAPQQRQAPPQGQAQQGGNPSFFLVNNTRRVIEEFYASPASERNWGPDRLGDAVVRPGQRFAIRLPLGECTYDVRIVFQGGEAQERRGFDACTVTDYVVR